MNAFHPTETCIICLQIPQLNLISLQSYSCVEISNSHQNENLKTEDSITEESQIAFMLTDISGHDFDSTSVNSSSGICEKCVKDLTTAYKFKKRCSAAFQQLNYFLSLKTNKEQNEETINRETDECSEQAFADSSFDEFEDESNNIPIEMVEIQEIDVDNNTKDSHQCEVCNRIFKRKTLLKRHMIIHTDERAFECTISGCGSRFRRLDHLKNHLNTHSHIKHECSFCHQTYSRADYLRNHIRAQHTKNKLQNVETAVILPENQVEDIPFNDIKDQSNAEVLEKQEIDGDKETKSKFKCEQCNKYFSRREHLKRHITIHTDERAFECTISGCGSRFRRLDHLKNHMNTHSHIKHECSFCHQTYSRADYLRNHIKAQHAENEFQNVETAVLLPETQVEDIPLDEIKDESNNMDAEVPEINENEDTDKKFKCDLCIDRVFSRKTHLKRHMTIHTNERAFECIQCNQKFRRRDHLQNHLNTHAQLRDKKCNFCDYATTRSDHLRNHIRARHTEKELPNEENVVICPEPECNRSFSSKKNLKAHEKSHSIKTFNCKRCAAEFSSKNDMNKHISKSHPNELKSHLCSECGIAFTRNDYLLIHMRKHRGETRYHCRFCKKGFFRSTDVRVHEKYHTNEKTHSCTICQKKFSRSYNLTIHSRVHTGEKPFVCTHTNCFQAFSQSNDLKVHLRRHTGERFKCDMDNCNESFIQMYLLTRHKRDVHGIEIQSNIRRLTKFIPFPLENDDQTIQPENCFIEISQSSNCTAQPMNE